MPALLLVAAVVQVAAAVAVVAGQGAGRAARDEVRSESVAGPEGPATPGAPAPALTAGVPDRLDELADRFDDAVCAPGVNQEPTPDAEEDDE